MTTLRCNMVCTICTTDSSPTNRVAINLSEKEALREAIEKSNPKILIFTGGEPTLDIGNINQIVDLSTRSDLEVHITTNGLFAQRGACPSQVLGRIKRLSLVELSWDKYHRPLLEMNDIKKIYNYCNEQNIKFFVNVCISSKLDLLDVQLIKNEIGCEITYQKVEASGRAKINNLNYNFNEFDKKLLDKKCPQVDQISFVAGRGFSICRSNLMFNGYRKNEIYHESLEEHLESSFYISRKSLTFQEMASIKKISIEEIPAKYSSHCGICEYIHDCN